MKRVRRLLTLAGIIGFTNAILRWEDILITKKVENCIRIIEDNVVELLRAYRLTPKESVDIEKKIRNMEFGVFPVAEIESRCRNNHIDMTQDTFDTIVEHAINYACIDCKRNIGACKLRRALKKTNVVCYDDQGKCEYYIKGVQLDAK